jgi:hypothetical protein
MQFCLKRKKDFSLNHIFLNCCQNTLQSYQKPFFQYCLSSGLMLAEIKSSAQQASILNYLTPLYSNYEGNFWVGMSDQAAEGTFLYDR